MQEAVAGVFGMGRSSDGPWWNAQKKKWFVIHEGKRVNLKTDSKREAIRLWYLLISGESAEPMTVKKITLKELGDVFFAEAGHRMSFGCLQNYIGFMKHLTIVYGERLAVRLTPDNVEEVSRNPKWSSTHRAGFIGFVMTLYRWGMRHKLISMNPVAEMRKPQRESRGAEAVISKEDHERLLRFADPVFADYLQMLWLTGARPGEISSITTEMVARMNNGVLPLKEHKTAHKGKTRSLVLNAEAVAVLQRRATAASGRLFPYNTRSVSKRMRELRERAGVGRVFCYGYRHAFATEALACGVPDATVAALLGHCDTSMIHRHYSHLSSRTQTLRDAVNKVR